MYGKDRSQSSAAYAAACASWYNDHVRGAEAAYMSKIEQAVSLFPELPHIERIASVVHAAASHTVLSFQDVADRFVNSYYVQGAYTTGRKHGYEGDALLYGMERALRYDLGILGDACDSTMVTR